MDTKNELVTPFGFNAALRTYDFGHDVSYGPLQATYLEIDAGGLDDPANVSAMIRLDLDAMRELRDAVIAHIAHRKKLCEAKVGAGETAPSA